MQDNQYNSEVNEEPFDDDELVISKSKIKREMSALQDIGKKLIELNDTQLGKMPISAELMRATKESRNITQREATRRHLQYIGKLMRTEDAEAIQYALDEFDSGSQRFTQALHGLELWRERLLNETQDVVTEYVEQHPHTDVQQLRQLIRNALKDQKSDKNTGAYKKLFQFLKETGKTE